MCVGSGGGGPPAGEHVDDLLREHVGIGVGVTAVDGLDAFEGKLEGLLLQSVHVDAEGMGCDGETALFVDDVNGLLGTEHGFDLLGEPKSDDLSGIGHDLVADDHFDVVELPGILLTDDGPGHCVVVGDAEDADPVLSGVVHLDLGADNGFGEAESADLGVVAGITCVSVSVRFSHNRRYSLFYINGDVIFRDI